MFKSKYVIISIIMLSQVLFGNPVWAESNDALIQQMQEQMERMQKRLTELEQKNAALEGRLADQEKGLNKQSERIAHMDKPASQAKDALSYVLGNMEVSGNLAGTIQGTSGNDDNSPEGDVTDATWSSELWLKCPLGENGKAAMLVEAGEGQGLQDEEVQTFHKVNDDSHDSDSHLHITNAFYNHLFMNDSLLISVGKMDIKDYFDTNAVAHDRHTQFLSSGFHHSIGVEWPDGNGLTIRGKYRVTESVDLSFCWTEAVADWEDVLDDSFAIGEVGFKPLLGDDLQGNYRLYGWFNADDKTKLDGSESNEDGYGVGLSADQKVLPWVTLFGRLAWEDDEVYEVETAWSTGLAMDMEPLNRPGDTLAVAFGQAITSGELDLLDEEHLEIYYRLKLTDYLALSTHFQYYWDPLGDKTLDDFAVFGVRAVVFF